jgi:hypothetical protein
LDFDKILERNILEKNNKILERKVPEKKALVKKNIYTYEASCLLQTRTTTRRGRAKQSNLFKNQS